MNARVIVDTSVWIDFFRGQLSARDKEACLLLIESEEACLTEIIKHELLVGANSQKDYRFLTDCLSALTELAIDKELRDDFNHFGFKLKTSGCLGKYTDSSIAFLAQYHRLQIFSFDRYFEKLARANIVKLFSV